MISASRQTGATLVVALILLMVATIITLSAVRFASTEVRIAASEETRINAFQQAQSVLDSLSNLDVSAITATTQLLCTAGIKDENGVANQDPDPNSNAACTATTLAVPNSYLAAEVAAGKISATARYVRNSPILRERGEGLFGVTSGETGANDELGAGAGTAIYRYYVVSSYYLRAADGLGETQVQQGLRRRFIEGGS
jgi:Tfp pilus assembly protein PilX